MSYCVLFVFCSIRIILISKINIKTDWSNRNTNQKLQLLQFIKQFRPADGYYYNAVTAQQWKGQDKKKPGSHQGHNMQHH